ncbi:hypothetical protein [Streptacidiphilus sp. PB12-B1b]|nr:hypothetical protein [Streptacidiphilus sp. PB12-B1b]
MDVTFGIDWAEDHHDVALVDADARLLGRLRSRLRTGHGDREFDCVDSVR